MKMINPEFLNTDEKYFADKKYMSVSTFKRFEKCEVDGMKEFGEMTPSMMIGSYIDAYVSGILDKFKEEHPEIISSRGKTKGELKSEFKQAEEICRYIDNDKILQNFLSGEKQVVMVSEINGVPFKIKIDSYSKGIAINDLKIMRSVTDNEGNYYDFISKWGYDLQLACYQKVVEDNTGEKLPVFIVAVTKETPLNSVVVNIPQNILDMALYRVETQIERFYQVWQGELEAEGCGKCSACIENRKATPIIDWDTLQGGSI